MNEPKCLLIYILNLVNPDFITIMYHLGLTPNTYEMDSLILLSETLGGITK
jgi:hypothetical protein